MRRWPAPEAQRLGRRGRRRGPRLTAQRALAGRAWDHGPALRSAVGRQNPLHTPAAPADRTPSEGGPR